METLDRVRAQAFVSFVIANDMTKRINKRQGSVLLNAALDPAGSVAVSAELYDKILAYLSAPDDASFDRVAEYSFARLFGTLRRALRGPADTPVSVLAPSEQADAGN